MDMKLDESLCRKFPLLYADRNASMNSTSMCWGFDVGDGWYKIIHDLSAKLESMIVALAEKQTKCECTHDREEHFRGRKCGATLFWQDESEPCVCDKFQPFLPRASQVKEKLGGLRFYMMSSTEEMEKLIDEAEALCYQTCETCGKPGVCREDLGWIQTLCDSHYQSVLLRHKRSSDLSE